MENQCTEERFLKDIATHQMHILLDNGLYRHIRFKRPDSSSYYFDIITSPGLLTFTGDMLTFIFARIEDMFDFFIIDKNDWNYRGENSISINPSYWAEKLLAAPIDSLSNGYKEYSKEALKNIVKEEYNTYIEEKNINDEEKKKELWKALDSKVLHSQNESEAYNNASFFEHDGFEFKDFWEHDLTTYTFHYIWACYAIAWGIKKYRRESKKQVQYGDKQS